MTAAKANTVDEKDLRIGDRILYASTGIEFMVITKTELPQPSKKSIVFRLLPTITNGVTDLDPSPLLSVDARGLRGFTKKDK